MLLKSTFPNLHPIHTKSTFIFFTIFNDTFKILADTYYINTCILLMISKFLGNLWNKIKFCLISACQCTVKKTKKKCVKWTIKGFQSMCMYKQYPFYTNRYHVHNICNHSVQNNLKECLRSDFKKMDLYWEKRPFIILILLFDHLFL